MIDDTTTVKYLHEVGGDLGAVQSHGTPQRRRTLRRLVVLQSLLQAILDDWEVAVRGTGGDVGVTVEGGPTVRVSTHRPRLPVLILLHDRPTPVASVPPVGARAARAAAVTPGGDININVITPRTTRHETRGIVHTRTDTTTGTIITIDRRRRPASVIMSVPTGDHRVAVGWTTVGVMAAGRQGTQRTAPGVSAGRRDGTVTTASVTGALAAHVVTGRCLARSGATTAAVAESTSQHITVRCSFRPAIAATLTVLLPLVVPAGVAAATTRTTITADDAAGTDTTATATGRPPAVAPADVGRTDLGFPVVRYPRLLRWQPVVTLIIARSLVAQQRGWWRRDGGR